MVQGTPLTEFSTLQQSQGPAWASGASTIINDATRAGDFTWTRLTTGKSMLDMVQGGDEITDTIFLKFKSTWRRYNPNVEFDYDNVQTGTQWTVPWAFASPHFSYTKHELGLNKETRGKYRAQRYKSVLFQKYQNLFTDVCESIEDEFWAPPDNTTMESVSPGEPRVPYSLPCFINEFTNGLPPGFTTVMRISSATEPNWDNQRVPYTYDASTAGDVDTRQIFNAFSRAYHRSSFGKLPRHAEYSEMATKPNWIATNEQGMVNYEHALRVNQDYFRGIGKTSGQDPDYDGPTFKRAPMAYIEALDTAAIYPTGAGGALSTWDDTAGTTNKGPRYKFICGQYITLVMHSENYLVPEPLITPSRQPFTRVQVYDMWNNNVARSRRRHVEVHPSTADIVDA